MEDAEPDQIVRALHARGVDDNAPPRLADFMGRPFSPMPELLATAESISKMLAICMRCGNPAKHTQRLVESEDLIVVGAAGIYEARCRRCFEPGIPRQEVMEFLRQRRDNGNRNGD